MRLESWNFRRAWGGRLPLSLAFALLCGAHVGCHEPPPASTIVKHLDEKLTPDDLGVFQRIVDNLPERRVPAIPPVFPPAPDWHERTLNVADLCDGEMRLREECWDAARLGEILARNQPLARALKKENLNAEQFAGLLLSIGAAASRKRVPENIDLDRLVGRSEGVIAKLKADYANKVFSQLELDTKYFILYQALWIPRWIRAAKMRDVPRENVELIGEHSEWLEKALPREFLEIRPEELQDLFEEKGVPFEELPSSGSDEDLDLQTAGEFRRAG